MAYPAGTKTLQQWLQGIDQIALNLSQLSEKQKAQSLASSLTMDSIRIYFDTLVQANNYLILAASVAGIGAYLKSEKQDAVADPVAEFNLMKAEVIDTLDWLRANVPFGTFGGTDYKLGYTFPASNTQSASSLTFTDVQTAGYRTQLDVLIGTIS